MTSTETHEPSPRRVYPQVSSLDSLVGGHPDALAKIFGAGRPVDPTELGDAPRGRLLALAHGGDVFLALRPILRGLASGASALMPWEGKTFDHGGNSGQNVVLGRKLLRFRAEVAASLLDGAPALRLTYDAPAYGNPWPATAVQDELRSVGKGIAIGPAIFVGAGAPITLLWFGLESRGG
jgi:hypothetical protein